jgi:ATP-dependent DNA helicase RecG
VLHGRLDAAEKRDLMQRFSEGRLDVLIATTVVEVGVDVPNATLMIVMDADRFGVSQLHQLRGRIGRGELPGTALLVTRAPAGTPARARVDAVASTSDGFELAELDLEQRSEGDVLGDEQSGRGSLRLLRVGRAEDQRLIVRARAVAEAVLVEDPELERHESLRALIDASLSTREAAHLRQG